MQRTSYDCLDDAHTFFPQVASEVCDHCREDVVNRQRSSRFEHTKDFAVESYSIADVHRDMLRPCMVEGRIVKWKIEVDFSLRHTDRV